MDHATCAARMPGETISVAMAVFNGARFLREQLDSIAAQTRLPDELVVTDDCSTDESVAIVRSFARTVPFRVRIVGQRRNIGILENFYAAFDAACGDVIFYCDQDDVWHPEKIARTMAALHADTMLLMHPSEIVDAALAPLGRTGPGNRRHGRYAFPADTATIHGYGHQMAFRRPVLDLMRRLRRLIDPDALGGFVGNLDLFIPFCAGLLGDIVVLADPLVRFRRHAGATSPAGAAIAAAGGSLAERWYEKARYRIAADAARSDLGFAIARAGVIHGGIPAPRAARLLHAFARKADRARRQSAVANGAGAADTLWLLLSLVSDVLRVGRFSNDAPLRAAGLSLIVACAGARRHRDPVVGAIETSPQDLRDT